MRKELVNRMNELNVNVKTLAIDTGVSTWHIYKIISGTRNPPLELAKRIADRLESTVDILFLRPTLDEVSNEDISNLSQTGTC
jgi:putative transcriptional regulator